MTIRTYRVGNFGPYAGGRPGPDIVGALFVRAESDGVLRAEFVVWDGIGPEMLNFIEVMRRTVVSGVADGDLYHVEPA